jgi:hypothetical protein
MATMQQAVRSLFEARSRSVRADNAATLTRVCDARRARHAATAHQAATQQRCDTLLAICALRHCG